MTKSERKRKTGSVGKRRRSSDGKSPPQSSSKLNTLTPSMSKQATLFHDGSTLMTPETEKPKINYQDELVLIFFDSMLDNIVDEWSILPSKTSEVCPCPKAKNQTKDSVESLVATPEDEEMNEILSSTLSLPKRKGSRRSSPGSKLNQQISERRRLPSLQSTPKKGRGSKSAEQVLSRTSTKRISKDLSLQTDPSKSLVSSCSDQSTLQSSQSLEWILNPPDELVKVKFKNGNCYEGPVSRRLMHGFGKFTWADGAVYEGDFVYGSATGKGTLKYPDLSFYCGNFCKSLLHGEGVKNVSGTTMMYSGNWKAGKKHGQGWLLYEPGDWYKGEWYKDKKQGEGLRHYKTGERYQGKWYQGERHGKGTFLWSNNDLYKGDWFGGIRHGYGEYTWNAFLNETLTFPLENIYQGTWLNGMRDGVGIMTFGTEGGAKLAGVWERDQKHGAGVMVCGNGTVIERNPLFWCDKPIHLETEANPGYPTTSPTNLAQLQINVHDGHPTTNTKSALQLIAAQIYAKRSERIMEPQALDAISQSQVQNLAKPNFTPKKLECSPLHIPVHLAPEQIDFSYYTNKAVQKYTASLYKPTSLSFAQVDDNICGGIKVTEGHPSTVSKYSKWNLIGTSNDLSKSKSSQTSPESLTLNPCWALKLNTLQTAQSEVEEKHLRNAITAHLPKLYKVYDKYATIASPQVLDFRPILVRFFLWQMLRDLDILGKQYTLVDIDNILMENPESGLESEHFPFEKIHFWQFLQILITLSWLLHSSSVVTEDCKRFGILSTIFKKFLTETIYKSVIATSGIASSLFEYRNLLPLNGVYLLYRSLGEPHTARTFLRNVCVKKNEHPPCYLKIFEDERTPMLRRGVNVVPVGGNLVFLPDDPPDIGQMPDDPDPKPPSNDPFRKELFALRSLGCKKVVQCLRAVCPHIACEGLIVNMEYPLTFIEFYETFLMCGFLAVDEVKGRPERMRLRREKRLKEQLEKEMESTKAEKSLKEKKKTKVK